MTRLSFIEIVPGKTSQYSQEVRYFSQYSSNRFSITDDYRLADILVVIGAHLWPKQKIELLKQNAIITKMREKTIIYDISDNPVYDCKGLYTSLDVLNAGESKFVAAPYFIVPEISNGDPQSVCRTIGLSFVGSRTHSIRRKMLDMVIRDCYVLDTSEYDSTYGIPNAQKQRDRYVSTLRMSEYVLCPRGHGHNSFRFYESLKYGAIPVLINDYCALPPFIGWDEGVIRLPVTQIRTLSLSRLRSMSSASVLCPVGRSEISEKCNGKLSLDYFGSLCQKVHEHGNGSWEINRCTIKKSEIFKQYVKIATRLSLLFA